MFGRKYVFETTSTRLKRRLLLLCLFVIMLFILYACSCLAFIFVSIKENQRSEDHLKTQKPDVIVVFTGDEGRISHGMKLAEKYPQAKLIISGVHDVHNAKSLMIKFGDGFSPNNTKRIIVDHLASNTIENVIYTLRYLRQNPKNKTALIISSDYHITRIKVILSKMIDHNFPVSFFYYGVPKNYQSFRSLKILFKEVFKLMKTASFMLLWEAETQEISNGSQR